MSGWIIALISGILMSVQGVWNAGVTKQSGVWIASAFVQLLALVVCIIAWFVTGRQGSVSDLMNVQPKYILLGGALGAFITYTVIQSMNQLGPARSVMLIVCAQLIAAYLINLFGWFGAEKEVFEWRKLIGVIVFLAGVVIFKWK
jgi:transporter family-2 protein